MYTAIEKSLKTVTKSQIKTGQAFVRFAELESKGADVFMLCYDAEETFFIDLSTGATASEDLFDSKDPLVVVKCRGFVA